MSFGEMRFSERMVKSVGLPRPPDVPKIVRISS
jgi:hypothetical protein